MVASGERQLRMLVVQSRLMGGFYVTMVPADLSPEETGAAFEELEIDGEEALEIGGWRTSSQNVAVAPVPFSEADTVLVNHCQMSSIR
jgi:hypothetical protein